MQEEAMTIRLKPLGLACASLTIIGLFLLVLSIVVLRPSLASAQGPELFTPVPSNQRAAATTDQINRIEQIKQRPTTASVELVHINTNALRGDTTRISIPNAQTLTMSRRSIELKGDDNFI